MKRFITLMLAFALVMGAVATSSAADIKAKGAMDFAFQWADNTDFVDEDGEDDFTAIQRVRTQIDIVASENLAGVLFFEIGTQNWGDSDDGAQKSTDGINVETRRAYIDFKVPATELNVRMGLQGFSNPSAAFGPAVLSSDNAGIVVSHPIADMGTVSAYWARQYADKNDESSVENEFDERDAFGVNVALDFDTIKATPYFIYASVGKDNEGNSSLTENATAYWFGVALEADVVENLFIDFDFVYGSMESDAEAEEAAGFATAAKVGYKLDMFTPVLFGFYTSGDDDDATDGSEVLPELGGDPVGATSFGTDAAYFDTTDSILPAQAGMWGVGVAVQDISFIEDLTHVVRVAYFQGTNDDDLTGSTDAFTTEDSAIEVNFDTKYQIYENLSAAVELGWVSVDIEDVDDTEDAWKAAVGFQYSF